MQNVRGEHRKETRIRRAHERDAVGQQNDGKEPAIAPKETIPFAHLVPEPRFFLAHRSSRREHHDDQRYDNRQKAHGVDKQTARDTDHADQHAAKRRAGDLSQVCHGGVERYCIHQIFARHEIIDQRMARGLIDRVHGAEKQHQNRHVPKLNFLKVDKRPENKRLQHREYLGREQQTAAFHTIDDGAADNAEQ